MNYYYKNQRNTKSNYGLPIRSIEEEQLNFISHLLGTILCIIVYAILLKKSSSSIEYFAYSMYIIGGILLYLMSSLYHFQKDLKTKRIFRYFDYMSIYFFISSTFAPILLLVIGGAFGLIFFIIQQVIVIFGVSTIILFGPGKKMFIHMPLYIILGWSGLLILPRLINCNYNLFIFILLGGILYTLGIIPFLIDKKYCHFIWHIFVLLGSILQMIGIIFFL